MPPASEIHRHLHPFHAILLSFPIALFFSAFISDVTYLNTEEIQWSNLSQWAIAGALLFGAPVVVIAVMDWLRLRHTGRRKCAAAYLALVCAMWLLGLINMFKHSQDGWSSVGAIGVLLSALCTISALIAAWILHTPATAETGNE